MHDAAASTSPVLITGATGYLGRRLAGRLRAEGFAVHAVTRAATNDEKVRLLGEDVTVHCHDGTTEGLIHIVAVARPVIAFHLAGLFIAPHQPADVLPLLQSNVVFGTQLLEALSVCGVKHIVNVGTWWQHFDDRAYCPVALYAATRQAFQDVIEYYTQSTPMRAITLKMFETYGEDDPRQKLFALLAQTLVDQKPLDMSPGDQPVDYVHIDDVLNAFALAGRRLLRDESREHEQYAVATRGAVQVRELARLFEEQSGKRLPIRWGARPHRPREMLTMCRAGEWVPGWSPKISLAEGIKRFLAARGI